MCNDKKVQDGADSIIKDADDAESKESLLQAKRLWNLRWCYNWYSRKCELEEKMHRSRQVNNRDMLQTSNVNLCVIQQILKVASSDSNNSSNELFGISETEHESTDDVTDESSPEPEEPPVEKKKYKLLKTPLHYIRVLKNKVSRNQDRYGYKAMLNKEEAGFPLLTAVQKSPCEKYEQSCGVPSRCSKSFDLIDFVSSSRVGNKCGLLALQCPACHIQQVVRSMGLKLQSPLNPGSRDGPSHLLSAEWREDSAGEKVIYFGDVSASETFPRATALRLLEESTHSPLCAYYIIRTIIRSVISSHFFNFLKTCKKRNAIENNLTTILRKAQGSHFLKSTGWRKELHSSPSCPVQNQLHSNMTTSVTSGVDRMFTSSYARAKYGDPRQRGGLPSELSLLWRSGERLTASANPTSPEGLLAQPQSYCATRSYATHDPEKSKTL